MITNEVTLSDFFQEFKRYDRDNFTREGMNALYNYLYDLSEDIGQDIELDVIALCVEYTEYKTVEEIVEQYDHLLSDTSDNEKVLEELREHTTVIDVTDVNDNVVGYILDEL